MIEILVVIVLVLAIFALIGAIWGRDTAQTAFGLSASCLVWFLQAVVVGVVLGAVLLVVLILLH